MSKAALILFLIGGIVFWFWNDDEGTAVRSFTSLFRNGETTDYIEIHDQAGRPLKCRVTAKRDPFIQIEREMDGQRFVIRTNSLDGPSSRMLSAWPDFNMAGLDADLYSMAQDTVKVELLTAPEMNTFRCQYTGKSMKSSTGFELDALRDYLKKIKVSSREVAVSLKKSPNGSFYYPPGIEQIPCIRIGDEFVYGRNGAAIRALMIKHYIKSVATPGLDRR